MENYLQGWLESLVFFMKEESIRSQQEAYKLFKRLLDDKDSDKHLYLIVNIKTLHIRYKR